MELEAEYPRLAEEGYFDYLEAQMAILDPQQHAQFIGGFTWMLDSPEDMDPQLTIYFTYAEEQITLQAVDDY